MELVDTRVLIVHRQVTQAVRLKQTLEQMGRFEVAAFTSPEAALDYLQARPQHVAVIDFTMSKVSGKEIVARLRAIQADIGIIAAPRLPHVIEAVQALDLNGVVDMPISARDLIPLIRQAAADILETLSDTALAPTSSSETETLLIRPSVLPAGAPRTTPSGKAEPGETAKTPGQEEVRPANIYEDEPDHDQKPVTLEVVVTAADQEEMVEEAIEIFRQLAAEEPPVPGFNDSATVRDLFSSVQDSELREITDAPEQKPGSLTTLEQEPDDAGQETGSTAHVILNSTRYPEDKTSPSLEDLLATLILRFPNEPTGVRPLPSWLRELERYVLEPSFLQDMPDDAQTVETDQEIYATTRPNAAVIDTIETTPGDLETEHIRSRMMPEFGHSTAPSSAVPEDTIESSSAQDTVRGPLATPEDTLHSTPQGTEETVPTPTLPAEDTIETDVPSERLILAHQLTEKPAAESPPPMPTHTPEQPEPRVARLALGLTQLSLEMTAEATLLTRGTELIASAGDLSMEEIAELQQLIYTGPEKQTVKARIRFVTLETSGMDYMLYSKQTEHNFTLSMVFAGDTPMRAIRLQANRLAEALETIPEEALDEHAASSMVQFHELQQLEEQAEAADEAVRESTQELQIEREALTGTIDPDLTQFAQPAPADTLTTCSYLWMLRDPDMMLTEPIARAIVQHLDDELTRDGWKIAQIHVYEDFVYMLADVPVNQSAHVLLPMLKRRSAEIAQMVMPSLDPISLWGDNYCVLTPGRELEAEEIQEFINFVRMQ